MFASHLLGLVKPDAAIFRAVLERLQTEPERVAFFDDAVPNVEAAAALGLRAFHIRGVAELRSQLASLGLVPAQTSIS